MTTVGVTGVAARWTVSPWGAVSGPDGALDWYVAAEDRWHVPRDEAAVRQQRVDGTPVVETRVRIPGGDVATRAWAVPGGGSIAIVEFENESPRAVAVAVTGDVVTTRPPSGVPVEGIDLPADAIVLPLGHRATVRVALARDGAGEPVRPDDVAGAPAALAVARGWTAVTDRASRLVLPDSGLAHAVTRARCELLLEGPVDPEDDPIGFLLDVAEMVRCGEPADAWLPECVEPAERIARSHDLDAGTALAAVRSIAAAAGDDRAVGDVDRLLDRRRTDRRGRSHGGEVGDGSDSGRAAATIVDLRERFDRDRSAGRFVRSVEWRLARPAVGGCDLLPGGFPDGWLGTDFEAHRLPAGPAAHVSYAVRWHGERPAVLWDRHGDPVRLTASDVDPDWSATDQQGEALWAPQGADGSGPRRSLSVEGVD